MQVFEVAGLPMQKLDGPAHFAENPEMPLHLRPYYVPLSRLDNTLVFESRFETGNLHRAVQVYEYEYDLWIAPDAFSGHTQWFYFSITNARAGPTYKFNIVNLRKPDSLFNHGMKPCVYSRVNAQRTGHTDIPL